MYLFLFKKKKSESPWVGGRVIGHFIVDTSLYVFFAFW